VTRGRDLTAPFLDTFIPYGGSWPFQGTRSASYKAVSQIAGTEHSVAFLDNILIESLWRSLKHGCVYLHAWGIRTAVEGQR
jgi:hypothetical protein